jgi:hypothetical protein
MPLTAVVGSHPLARLVSTGALLYSCGRSYGQCGTATLDGAVWLVETDAGVATQDSSEALVVAMAMGAKQRPVLGARVSWRGSRVSVGRFGAARGGSATLAS